MTRTLLSPPDSNMKFREHLEFIVNNISSGSGKWNLFSRPHVNYLNEGNFNETNVCFIDKIGYLKDEGQPGVKECDWLWMKEITTQSCR